MPKKTRQEKILAQLKRLQQQQNSVANPTAEQNSNLVRPAITITSNLKSFETKENSDFAPINTKVMDYSYAYKDLRKTLIFVSLAIIFEIILSRVI